MHTFLLFIFWLAVLSSPLYTIFRLVWWDEQRTHGMLGELYPVPVSNIQTVLHIVAWLFTLVVYCITFSMAFIYDITDIGSFMVAFGKAISLYWYFWLAILVAGLMCLILVKSWHGNGQYILWFLIPAMLFTTISYSGISQ